MATLMLFLTALSVLGILWFFVSLAVCVHYYRQLPYGVRELMTVNLTPQIASLVLGVAFLLSLVLA